MTVYLVIIKEGHSANEIFVATNCIIHGCKATGLNRTDDFGGGASTPPN